MKRQQGNRRSQRRHGERGNSKPRPPGTATASTRSSDRLPPVALVSTSARGPCSWDGSVDTRKSSHTPRSRQTDGPPPATPSRRTWPSASPRAPARARMNMTASACPSTVPHTREPPATLRPPSSIRPAPCPKRPSARRPGRCRPCDSPHPRADRGDLLLDDRSGAPAALTTAVSQERGHRATPPPASSPSAPTAARRSLRLPTARTASGRASRARRG